MTQQPQSQLGGGNPKRILTSRGFRGQVKLSATLTRRNSQKSFDKAGGMQKAVDMVTTAVDKTKCTTSMKNIHTSSIASLP